MAKDYVDFEVIREPWNEYSLQDGAYIKSRNIVVKILKKDAGVGTGSSYGIEVQNITVTLNTSEELRGTPDTKAYSPEELASSIIKDDLDYKTLSEEWCEYFTDDGTKIRLKSTVTKISLTDKHDKDGNPIYLVQFSNLIQVTPKKYT